MSDAAPPPPDWWTGEPPDAPVEPDEPSPVQRAQEEAWEEHRAAMADDEPLPTELPGGTVWQALYDEATAAAAGSPTDLWNRISEEERGRYCTLAAIDRRHRVEHSAERDRPSGRNNPLPFVTAAELVAQTPPVVPWVVRHLLARGALTELDGQAKRAGKTTLLGHMFAAMLSGRDFLGEPTIRTPIVLLTEMADTPLRQLLERAGLATATDLRILRWTDSRLRRWPDIVADAVAECGEHGAGVLCVDTLPQFAGIRGDSENDAGSALAAMEPLQAASAGGLAVLVSRHERKGGGVVGESARGSTAFTGTVDIILRLAVPLNPDPARGGVRELSVLSRFDGAPEKLMIELTEAGYEFVGTETAVAFAEARNDLRDMLPDQPAGLTMAEILEATRSKRTTIQAALEQLVDQGQVVRSGRGHRGSPVVWSRVSAEAAPAETRSNASGISRPGIHSAGDPPYGGGSHPAERNGGSGTVGGRMAAILDEPEDLDEPDDLPSVAASMFGDLPTGGMA